MMNILDYKYHNEPLSAWLVSCAYIIGAFVVGQIILQLNRRVFRKWVDKTANSWDNIVLDIFETPLIFGINLFGIWLALEQLHFSPQFDLFITRVYRMLTALNVTWFVARLLKSSMVEFSNKRIAQKGSLDKHVTITLRKIFVVLIWIIGIVVAMQKVGVNLKALLAGLGIGGIAFALAAQDTLKNILGGLTIFADRPFLIGDRIKVGNFDGFIEDIGIRSIRLRTLENRLVTIPNSTIADGAVENVTQEPSTRVIETLGLTYDTTPDKMNLAIELLINLPKSIPDILPDITAAFTNYSSSSMDITFIFYVRKRKPYYETISAVNLEILRQFNAGGLSFAFPTQTLYLQDMQDMQDNNYK
jgi:MscS family membrane protein